MPKITTQTTHTIETTHTWTYDELCDLLKVSRTAIFDWDRAEHNEYILEASIIEQKVENASG